MRECIILYEQRSVNWTAMAQGVWLAENERLIVIEDKRGKPGAPSFISLSRGRQAYRSRFSSARWYLIMIGHT